MRFFTRQVVICLSHPQQERANKVGKPTPTQDLRVNYILISYGLHLFL
jgi:hypothetical protein